MINRFRIAVLMLLTAAAPVHNTVGQAGQANTLPPSFSIVDATWPENIGVGLIIVQKNKPDASPSVVNVRTADELSNPGVDYQPVNVNVTFAPGELEKRIPVSIINNPAATGERNFWAKVTPVSNALLARDYGQVMIADLNQATPTMAWVPAPLATGGYMRLVAPDKGWDNYWFSYDNIENPTYVGQIYKITGAGYSKPGPGLPDERTWQAQPIKKNRFGTYDVYYFLNHNVQGVAPAPGYTAP